MNRLTRISLKTSFTYKAGFIFQGLTQSRKSHLVQLETVSDLVYTFDLFTKRLIHRNLFELTFEFKIRKLRAYASVTFQLHFVFKEKKP